MTTAQQPCGRVLGGRCHGKIKIQQYFQAGLGCLRQVGIAPANDPSQLYLGQTQHFRKAVQRESQRLCAVHDRWHLLRCSGPVIVRKYLVDNQRQAVVAANLIDSRQLLLFQVVAGWVVGVDHDNRSAPGSDQRLQHIQVNRPSFGVVIAQRIRERLQTFKTRQVGDQWISGSGNKDLVSRVSQQLEKH